MMVPRSSSRPPEHIISGLPASPGLAFGAIVTVAPSPGTPRPAGQPAQEGAALDDAIATALREIEALALAVGGDGRDLLEFQAALLNDDALRVAAVAAIGAVRRRIRLAGSLVDQVDDYARADNHLFRARAADLADVRDRVLRHLRGGGAPAALPPGAIAVAPDLTPSQFLETDWSKGGGVVLATGAPPVTSAMLARARSIPMVVGLGDLPLAGHSTAFVDGGAGRIVLSPAAGTLTELTREQAGHDAVSVAERVAMTRPPRTRDGIEISLSINIAGPDDLADLDPAACDGIGLFRTEMHVP